MSNNTYVHAQFSLVNNMYVQKGLQTCIYSKCFSCKDYDKRA